MSKKASNKLETFGNEETMNLNSLVYQNIKSSQYFKNLYELKTYHEVVSEIKNEVHSLKPFMKDTFASTAYCLLFKLWTLKLTIKQVNGLINYQNCSEVRALGFLYLRYVCKPDHLWSWFEDYLDDEEEVQIEDGVNPRIITIGRMCRQLLTEQKWLDTILPRIPLKIAQEIDKKIRDKHEEERKKEREKYEEERKKRHRHRSRSRSRDRDRDRSRHSRHHHRSRDRSSSRDRSRHSRHHYSRDRSRRNHRSRSRSLRDRHSSRHHRDRKSVV